MGQQHSKVQLTAYHIHLYDYYTYSFILQLTFDWMSENIYFARVLSFTRMFYNHYFISLQPHGKKAM